MEKSTAAAFLRCTFTLIAGREVREAEHGLC